MTISKSNLLLAVVFGSSAWIGTNSVWMQLPLITAKLPEGWSLPSYLATVVQIACVAPLIYGIIHKGFPGVNIQPAALITTFLSIACVCQLGLAFLWSVTVDIGNGQYSLCLYLLLFGLAVVNSISNVLFMPFMAKFHPHYLNAYFVGMGFSSLIPSLLSLIQGSSNYQCVNDKVKRVPLYLPPRFSVSIFFVIIFLWTCLALFSFLMLYRRGTHTLLRQQYALRNRADGSFSDELKKPDEGTPLKKPISENPENLQAGSLEDVMGGIEKANSDNIGTKAVWFLLITTAVINAQMNGVIPSVQSYAALPYSQATYHYGITLSNVVSPLSSFLSFFITIKSYYLIGIMAVCSSVTTAFIVYLASLSPNLIFDSVTAGSIMSIGAALIAAGLHSYLRVEIASCLRRSQQSESHVFWCGAFIQIGSFIGSALMFPLVNIAHVFKSVTPCST